ncbi:hypothetical protein [Sporolactobacillus sp. KGMB 08714]|uniref:hypothetical protein n=1 Tax=Sporolactobacillus sp. KGMB 08714 TaxID=3064704 RepID=UPI002FBD937B
MFEEMSAKQVKKLHEEGGKISGVPVVSPHHVDVVNAQERLETIFEGRVNGKYVKETLIAKEYAESHHHFQTGSTLLDDIEQGKTIDFNDYR